MDNHDRSCICFARIVFGKKRNKKQDMIIAQFEKNKRSLRTLQLTGDLVIVGGGMSGVCAAISAARAGINVILIQDRPVLGGNASSEIRLWILGATSHMGNNNRWSREGGIIDEILVENLYRNKEGNPVIFDTIILDKVKNEPNITLLLNTVIYDIEKSSPGEIAKVMGFCNLNHSFYEISGQLFCDASGDGILAYRAGAAFRMGAEDALVYNEKFAPDPDDFGELQGHTIYFYSKDAGRPVQYIAPSYALKNIEKIIPRYHLINSGEYGCKFWWIEYGGRLDTVHDTENIKWELWSIVYGVWHYIKNSGVYPGTENLTLEWVGLIPGKRENRRFLGHYTLIQQDVVEQRSHDDAVAYGGWAIDLHPSDGIYSPQSGCIQYHSKGIYPIPYRCYVSKDVRNLFFAGRCISASHVAHGSTRVMATSASGGQAVGTAAALCMAKNLSPADLIAPPCIRELQLLLNIAGQKIPGTKIKKESNPAGAAKIEASGSLELSAIHPADCWYTLDYSIAQLLPLQKDTLYSLSVWADASEAALLEVELRYSSKPGNYTPDIIAEKIALTLNPGKQTVTLTFTKGLPDDRYGFITFLKNKQIKLQMSHKRYTGIVSVFNKYNHAVNNHGKQTPPENSGMETFEFWCPERRPDGQNIAMNIQPPVNAFDAGNIINGFTRPTTTANAWVAPEEDAKPEVKLTWNDTQTIRLINLFFDTDFDHAMESVQMGHPENRIPFCVKNYTIFNDRNEIVFEKKDNYQTINKIEFTPPLLTSNLRICIEHPSELVPAALFQIWIG
jgi:hypothetical protein